MCINLEEEKDFIPTLFLGCRTSPSGYKTENHTLMRVLEPSRINVASKPIG